MFATEAVGHWRGGGGGSRVSSGSSYPLAWGGGADTRKGEYLNCYVPFGHNKEPFLY